MDLTNPKREPVGALLDRHISLNGKPLNQIAKECGFPRPNVLSVIRTGHTKLPMARIPALARSLGLVERELFEAALQEYQPDLTCVLEELYGISRLRPLAVAPLPPDGTPIFGRGDFTPHRPSRRVACM